MKGGGLPQPACELASTEERRSEGEGKWCSWEGKQGGQLTKGPLECTKGRSAPVQAEKKSVEDKGCKPGTVNSRGFTAHAYEWDLRLQSSTYFPGNKGILTQMGLTAE